MNPLLAPGFLLAPGRDGRIVDVGRAEETEEGRGLSNADAIRAYHAGPSVHQRRRNDSVRQ